MPQNVINLGECSYEFEKKKTFCCSWLKKSVDSNYNQLIDSVAEVRHVLPGFLRLLGAIISDRGVLKSPTMIVDWSLSPFSCFSFGLI